MELRRLLATVGPMVTVLLTACGGATTGGTPTTPPTPSIYCGAECTKALTLKADPASINCKVGLSWNSASHPYGARTTKETPEFAKQTFPNMQVIVADGRGDAGTQTGQVDDLIARGIKVLILSPADAKALVGAADRATKAGIKVIASDRTVATNVVTYIGSDNVEAGLVDGKYAVQALNGKGNVVELSGSLGASPTIDRAKGFRDGIAGSNIKIIGSSSGDYDRAKGLKVMEDFLQRFGKGQIDAIFAHNDEMAFGAIQAIKEAGRQSEIKVIGVDGEATALERIQAGEYAATAAYPLVVREHTIAAAMLCAGETLPPRIKLDSTLITKDNVAQFVGKSPQ